MEKAVSVNLWGSKPHRLHGGLEGEEVEIALSSYLFRKPRGKEREKLKTYKPGDNCWIKVPKEKGRGGIQILGGRTYLSYQRTSLQVKLKQRKLGYVLVARWTLMVLIEVGNKY